MTAGTRGARVETVVGRRPRAVTAVVVATLVVTTALVVIIRPARPAAAAGDPVIAAAGDIACDPLDPDFHSGAGTTVRCHQLHTSDLLVASTWDAVLALGDTQYDRGAPSQYAGSYDPSWGRVKAVTRPAVGNHEYQTSGAHG